MCMCVCEIITCQIQYLRVRVSVSVYVRAGIAGLDVCGPHLRLISLQSNRLTQLEGLNTCTALEELYVSHNGLKAAWLSELRAAHSTLTVLDLAANHISGPLDVVGFTALADLWLNNNAIERVTIDARMTRLSCVYMEGNPAAAAPDYRTRMVAMVPSLTQLDALSIQ